MVTVGGGIGNSVADGPYAVDPGGQQRQVELYSPATKRWTLGPAQIEDRGYHSTALLLPNGRVWSAGDEKHPFGRTAAGRARTPRRSTPRPTCSRARGRRSCRRQANCAGATCSGCALERNVPANSAVLVAPGATTHGDDATSVSSSSRCSAATRAASTSPRRQAGRRAARLLHALRSEPGRALGRLMGEAHRERA